MNAIDLEKFKLRPHFLGVTGSIASGKSRACLKLKEIGSQFGVEVSLIGIDEIRRRILGLDKNHLELRKKIAETFGSGLLNEDGSIDRKDLGEIIFGSDPAMKKFKEIVAGSINPELSLKLSEQKNGLVLVEWAMLAEDGFLPAINYNALLMKCSREVQFQRLEGGDLPLSQVEQRINSQLSCDENEKLIKKIQFEAGFGKLFVFDTSLNPKDFEYASLFNEVVLNI
jgi:dephospho-CoA kinase